MCKYIIEFSFSSSSPFYDMALMKTFSPRSSKNDVKTKWAVYHVGVLFFLLLLLPEQSKMFSFYREREAIWRSTRGDRWQQKWVVFFKKAAASRPAQNLTTTSSHGHYITSKPAERIGRKRNKKVVVNRLESTKPSTRFPMAMRAYPSFYILAQEWHCAAVTAFTRLFKTKFHLGRLSLAV